MRTLVYSERKSGLSPAFECIGKRYNVVLVEIYSHTTLSFPDVLSRGSIVMESDGFAGDLWKLFALNHMADYLKNKHCNYDKIVHDLCDGYGGYKFGHTSFCVPIYAHCHESENFKLRVSECHAGIYGVPQNEPFSYRVSLFYDDDVKCPRFRYMDYVKQGDDKTLTCGGNNVYMLATMLPITNELPLFSADMDFSVNGVYIPLGSIMNNLSSISNPTYFDSNQLLGYPFANVHELSVRNCYYNKSAYVEERYKQFDFWEEY